MAFKLQPGRSMRKRLRKVVCERIDMALAEVQAKARPPGDEAVHRTRRRLKQIRGTLRLAREDLGKRMFRQENRVFRDAGRPLSAVRDAKTIVDTLDKLIEHFGKQANTPAASRLRKLLVKRHRSVRGEVLGQDGTIRTLVRELRAAKTRVNDWPLRHRGFGAIGEGLRRIYADARCAMDEAVAAPTDQALHEWRKRTQDLRYTLDLLQPGWPETVEPLAEQVHKLSDLLGDDHDLLVLRDVAEETLGKEAAPDHEAIAALIDARRQALQKEAHELGVKLYQEDEDAFTDRLTGYWKAASRASDGRRDTRTAR